MVYYNGDLLPDTAHFTNHSNRGLRYGDGLTESLKYGGKHLYFWEAHYFALMAAMRQLRMEIPMDYTMEYLEGAIRRTLLANGLDHAPAGVTLMAMRSEDMKGVDLIITVEVLPRASFQWEERPVRAELFKDYFLPSGSFTGLPHTNRLIEVLGGIYKSENGYDTCLLLNEKKEVIRTLEGPVFLREGDQVRTPAISAGAPDTVLRKQVLQLGNTDTRYSFTEGGISPFDLQKADELFWLDPLVGVCSITAYRKATFRTEAARHITGLLNAAVDSGVN